MTAYLRIASLKPQASDLANRVIMAWVGPDGVQREYAVNQRTMTRYTSAAEAAPPSTLAWANNSWVGMVAAFRLMIVPEEPMGVWGTFTYTLTALWQSLRSIFR